MMRRRGGEGWLSLCGRGMVYIGSDSMLGIDPFDIVTWCL
jgi:hypothetical protein